MDPVESIGLAAASPLDGLDYASNGGLSLLARSSLVGRQTRTTDSSSASAGGVDAKEEQISKDFESVLLTKVFEEVERSLEESGFDEEDSGGQQVRGLFWFYLAQDVANKGGFGLWKDIYKDMKQTEENAAQIASAGQEAVEGIDEEL